MGTKTILKSLSHSVYNLNYHLVIVTKYRRKVITKAMLTDLEGIFSNVCAAWRCELVEFNGEADHVHLLISAHPNLKLSDLVNNLKTASSRRIRRMYKSHVRQFYWKVRHEAAQEMRVGPSKSAYRCRLQTTLSCAGKEPVWLALRKRHDIDRVRYESER